MNESVVIVAPASTGTTDDKASFSTIFAIKLYGAPSRTRNCFIVVSVVSSTTETPTDRPISWELTPLLALAIRLLEQNQGYWNKPPFWRKALPARREGIFPVTR